MRKEASVVWRSRHGWAACLAAAVAVLSLVAAACREAETGATGQLAGTTGEQTQTPVISGPAETGSTETGPAYNGPTYKLGPVTEEDIAVGDAFLKAWLEGDGEVAAAMFAPEGTFDGFQAGILPALHDWFRAGGWTFGGGGCGIHGWGPKRGVVGCGFTYENDLTRALGMQPADAGISFVTEAGRIETAWFGGGGDTVFNMFGSPDPGREDLVGPVWDMFIEWLSSNHLEDFARMYDPDYGYPVRGYPILDAASIKLWERYTDEFVASPEELASSFPEWMARQSLEVQARRICITATDRFWARARGDDLHGHERSTELAKISEETLAELRALPFETEADRATMDAFVPLAERWIEGTRLGELDFFEDRDLRISMMQLIGGCLITGFPG